MPASRSAAGFASSRAVFAAVLLAAPAFAFQAPPPGRVLPDVALAPVPGENGAPSLLPASRAAALATLGVPGPVALRWHPATGRPRWLHAHGRPLGSTAAAPGADAARAFLAGHRQLFGLARTGPEDLALEFVERDSAGTTHVGFTQRHQGLEVLDGFVRVDFDRAGRVVAAGLGEAREVFPASALPAIGAADAIGRAVADTGGAAVSSDTAQLVWLPSGATARLAWRVEVQPADYPARYEVLIDASSGERLRRRNLLRYAATEARIFTEHPDASGRSLVAIADAAVNVDPVYPAGWLDVDRSEGNNVLAQDDRAGDDELTPGLLGVATAGTPQRFDPAYSADPAADLELSAVNLFWAINRSHQYFYRLGFDEAAGNFQRANFGRGGAGGDPVRGDAQDAADTLFDADPGNDIDNNANFFTPSDGSAPRMQMYLWRFTTPWRDSALDLDIVIHEFCHGVSNRLVGGRRNASCLATTQAGAMGEAWGDFFAASYTDDPVVAEFSTGDATRGIRTAPIDADSYTYGDLCSVGAACEVHDDGEIWAQHLWEMRAALVAIHGPGGGRDLAEQLIIDGMKLAPCNPTFLDMRDAIVLADELRHAGAHHCLLWTVFASNGMGDRALADTAGDETAPIEDFSLPAECDPAQGDADVLWQFDRSGCDAMARVRVVDADATLPATVVMTSDAGDALVLPLAAGPAGPPVYLTAPFPVIGVASPVQVVPTDAILQAVRGDQLTATFADATTGLDIEEFADLDCLADVRLGGYRFSGGTCDADTVAGFPDLPGFLDAGETAVLEVSLENHEAFALTDVSVTLSSSNPSLTLVPLGPRIVPSMPGLIGSDPQPVVVRFLATAGTGVLAFETADLTLALTARGYDGALVPIAWTIRMNLDYQLVNYNLSEDFSPASPTLASWRHAPLRATPNGDEWRTVTCKSASAPQAYKNGGGDPVCGNYSDNQGDPYLAAPPVRVLSPGIEAGRLTRLRFNHLVQLARPTDPVGACDAEAVGILLANDPATIDTSNPFALIDQAIALYTVIPALGLDDNTTGFVPVDIDLGGRDFPGIDFNLDVFLTWVFAVDVSNRQSPFCGLFPAVGEGYYLDDLLLEGEQVVAVPQATACTPACKALAEATPVSAYACAGAPVDLSGASSLVAGCAGTLEYRWSGGELGAGSFGPSPAVTARPPGPTVYTLDVRCTTDLACTASVPVVVGAAAGAPTGGPIGNALRLAKAGTEIHFDWSARALVPRRYHIHEAADRTLVTDLSIGAQPIAAAVDDAETRDLATPVPSTLYEVYGRDICTGLSVIP